jgi:c-di-GMP-binding flagellar brake protein YcgR
MPFVLAGRRARGETIMFKRRGPRADGQPRFGDRRKAKRQAAGWESRYRVVDVEREHLHYAGDDFETCVLTDLSMEGAGLHLVDGEVTVGDRLELDLPLGAHKRASIQVRAEVRHATVDEGAPRAGLEFIDVGDLERALLYRLLRDLNQDVSQTA